MKKYLLIATITFVLSLLFIGCNENGPSSSVVGTYVDNTSTLQLKANKSFYYENMYDYPKGGGYQKVTGIGTYTVKDNIITCSGTWTTLDTKYVEDNEVKEGSRTYEYYGSYLIYNNGFDDYRLNKK